MGHKYAVVGTGRMGRAVAWHLINDPKTEVVKLFDVNDRVAAALGKEFLAANLGHKVEVIQCDSGGMASKLYHRLDDVDVVVATCGYQHYVDLTKHCAEKGIGMVDLGGNRDVVEKQKAFHDVAQTNGATIIPDCGLAPGLIGILGMHAFQVIEHRKAIDIGVHLRVGGLPRNPGSLDENPLQYELTWSADGLINEYEIPADELRDGVLIKVAALSEKENAVIKTPWEHEEFEAFVTGGGSSNLPALLQGRARNVDYKTIRYRGHCDIMRGIQRLGFFSKYRPALTQALQTELTSKTDDDIVIARAGARGMTQAGKPTFVFYELFCEKDLVKGFSAMAQTTGYSAAIVAQMIADETIKLKGVVDGEVAVPGQLFIDRFQTTGIKIKGIHSK
jgi:lysine 6-dehydrogenase